MLLNAVERLESIKQCKTSFNNFQLFLYHFWYLKKLFIVYRRIF